MIVSSLYRLLKMCWPVSWKRLPYLKENFLNSEKENPQKLIISSRNTSTLGYYFKPRYPNAEYRITSKIKPSIKEIRQGSSLVVVRCVSLSWLIFIRRNLEQFSSITFFIDDDLPAIIDDHNLPLGYILKRAFSYIVNCMFLDSVCDRILVSTETLANKYNINKENVLPPKKLIPAVNEPPFYQKNMLRSDCKTIFYHGTTVHIEEIRWLYSIIKDVLTTHPDVLFEVMGGEKVRLMYADLRRVRVVHPMEWEKYLEYTSTVNYDIGLAPLLPTAFNRCRSHVKYFDISRTGAIGIYSNNNVYAGIVRHHENGFLLENDKKLWVETICYLLNGGENKKRITHFSEVSEIRK